MGKRHCFSVVASREVILGGMGRSSRMTRRDFIASATLVFVAPTIHVEFIQIENNNYKGGFPS
jgi:hypothetical protein